MASRLVNDGDLYFLQEGTHMRLADALGAHLLWKDDQHGANFALWAPRAKSISVIGDFNGWIGKANPMKPKGVSGVWEAFIPGVSHGSHYKYLVESDLGNYQVEKSDPLGAFHDCSPSTESIVWNLDYQWRDEEWMASRKASTR